MTVLKESKYTEEKVLWIKYHSDKQMTFAISRPETFRFNAGQFARLGFRIGNGFIWRAYSMMSAAYADELQFFVILIEEGQMSQYFKNLQIGDSILLDKLVTGFFLPERFVDGQDLVMLSTGSGIAPFLSQLQEIELWQRFDRVLLVHSVSYESDLIFSDFIQSLQYHDLVGEYFDCLTYIPVTTQENNMEQLHQRIPELITSRRLERQINWIFSQEKTRFMVCGNPKMVEDTFKALLLCGFSMHRNKIPGQIIMENGF